MESQNSQLQAKQPDQQLESQSSNWGNPAEAATQTDSRPETVQQKQMQDAANRSPQVQQLKTIQRNANQGNGIVQRKISYQGTDYPTTWKGIARMGNADMTTAAQQIWDRLVQELGADVNVKKLEAAWNKIAKDTTNAPLDIETEADALVDAIKESYNRSMRSRAGYDDRNREAQELAGPLVESDDHFSFVPSARNPMVVRDDLEEVKHDGDEVSRADRLQTYASTLMMDQHPTGQEAQAAVRQDGAGMHLSMNTNSVNEQLRGQYALARDLKDLAARLLMDWGLATMTREAAMADRRVRHALKLYERISGLLASNAPITVPGRVPAGLDGVHAEIRIEQDDDFDLATHNLPTGTKYPCMGCFLYFNGKKIRVGKWFGPMWVTNAALSQQLKEALENKRKIGKLGKARTTATGGALRDAHAALPAGSRMGHGRTKAGDHTYDHNADSESEYESEEFEFLRKRVKSHHAGAPMSPVWEGVDDFEVEDPEVEYDITSEGGVDAEIRFTVREFMRAHRYDPGRPVFVVDGTNWTCYIRAVLHHLGQMARYDDVMTAIASHDPPMDLNLGVEVGSDQETAIQAAIEAVLGIEFHVLATDAAHGNAAQSANNHGAQVPLLLTGVHFSLLR